MPYRDLREFLARLEAAGQLRRVTRPVSTRFEIAAGIRKMSDLRGPALLFENVVGHEMRVAGAVFAPQSPCESCWVMLMATTCGPLKESRFSPPMRLKWM